MINNYHRFDSDDERIVVQQLTASCSCGQIPNNHHGQRKWWRQWIVQQHTRQLRLLPTTGNVHSSDTVCVHIFCGHRRKRVSGVDIHPAQAHDQCAEHIHTQPGAGWSAGPVELHTFHVHRLHGNIIMSSVLKANYILLFLKCKKYFVTNVFLKRTFITISKPLREKHNISGRQIGTRYRISELMEVWIYFKQLNNILTWFYFFMR